jgi:hypothetical protein
MTAVRPRIRELAERASSGTRVRLLWRQGTRQLWVEVREPGMDQALAILVPPERALDAFHHPYAYAARTISFVRQSRSSVREYRQHPASE